MSTRRIAAISVALALMLGASAPGQVNPLRIIADTDTLVPGGPGNTFQTFFQLNGLDPDISGRNVVFMACCPTGVYGWFNGELRTIVDLNSTFPGTGNPLGFDFTSPTISGENVAFSCRDGRPGPGAICAFIDGRLEVIAESAVTLVPGRNETFGTFFMLNGTGPATTCFSGRFPAIVTATASRIVVEQTTRPRNRMPSRSAAFPRERASICLRPAVSCRAAAGSAKPAQPARRPRIARPL